jgi:hypothetical protein
MKGMKTYWVNLIAFMSFMSFMTFMVQALI